MKAPLRQDGIILDLKPYGDSDLILTALLKDDGLRRFFARDARRSQKRFAGLLDRFARLEFFYEPRSQGLWSLAEVHASREQHLPSSGGTENSLETFALLGLLAEVICAFSWEEMPATRLYELWTGVLEALRRGQDVRGLAELALRECLADFGYDSGNSLSLGQMLDFIQATLQKPIKAAGFFLDCCAEPRGAS